jgi:sulfite reductase beta subunit
VEFLTPNWDHVEKIIGALEAMGHPVGGTGNSISGINHTQGWLHCDIPATDGSGVAKAVMDELVQEFIREEMPNRVRLSTSCCAINCGGQSDLAIIIQHTRPPRIDHDKLSNICELPKVVARCPVAAIRPVTINGKRSLIVEEAKCVVCGACFAACPSMEINHPEHSKLAVWVGGKHSSTRSKPSRMKLVAHGLPNNPPRWPEVMDVVKRILYAYKEGGRGYERLGEWIDRIGWKKFFGVTELTFDENMIDSYRLAQTSWNHSTHIRFP